MRERHRVTLLVFALGASLVLAGAVLAQDSTVSPSLPQAPAVWPRSLEGWAALIGEILTIAGVIGGVLWKLIQREVRQLRIDLWGDRSEERPGALATMEKRLVDQIDGLGRTVNAVRESCSTHTTKIGTVELSQQDRTQIRSDVGKLEGLIERLAQENAARDAALGHTVQNLAVTMAEFRADMKNFREAKDDILALLKQVRNA